MNELGALMRSRQEPGEKRTAAATAGRMRKSEERKAAALEGRGWVTYPPEMAEWVKALVERAMA